MSEMTAFDPKAVEAAIAEEIKNRFAAMVPVGAWEGLVKKHVDNFLNGKGEGTLQKLVVDQLTKQVEEELKNYFSGDKWGWQWKDGQKVASEATGKLVMQHMPEIIQMMLARSVQSFIETMRSNIGRNGNQW